MTDFPELQRLREAVLTFAGSRDLAAFWDLVCANSRTLIPARRVCAILLSDFDLIYLQAARENDAQRTDLTREFPPTKHVLYESMTSGRPTWLWEQDAPAGDRNNFEQWLYRDQPPLILILPLSNNERVIGSLIFALDAHDAPRRESLESAGELYALHVGLVYSLLSVQTGMEMANRRAVRRNEELKESRARLTEMNRELEEADRLKQEFLANMSHELRTPLNSVIGFSDLLARNREGNLTEKNLSHVEKINRNGKYLLQMINNLLDFTLLRAGEVEFENTEVSLGPVLEEATALMRPRATPKGIELNCVELETDLFAQCDAGRLKQILTTLISNAIKFVSDENGRVDITAQAVPRGARIIVSDNGVGISREKLQVILEPFRQGDGSSTRDHGGLGLGLTIARELTEAMGGELQVESEEGRGSRFILLFRR